MSKYSAFFVSTEIHKRTVELADGSKHELHFRELPVADYRKFQIAEASKDEDVRAASISRMIAASMCEPDGSPSVTVEQAMNMKPNVSSRLFDVVLSLGGIGPKGEASPPGAKSGSGTSSLSPSEADPSQSGNPSSPQESSSGGQPSTEATPSTTSTDTTAQRP
ncbi:hypothetical protein [Variovorax sp. tm]|uniref:hypothetical protein n=1 Tax=Variovorax atrisoli TaxID=3394203 RepID=UPI003A8052DB